MLSKIKKHILNSRGKALDKKYVVFESDDWGSERIPGKKELEYLVSNGIDPYSNPFNYLDSLETEQDLQALFEVLTKHKDHTGGNPLITANSVCANPDFEKIRSSGMKEYFYESVDETYKRKKDTENTLQLIKEGIQADIYHPQFHGREHLNIQQWMTELQNNNEVLTKAFDAGVFGIDLQSSQTSRNNFMAAFDGFPDKDGGFQTELVKSGTELFERLYGYSSKSFIAPCYVWHTKLEKALAENGISYIQGLPIQYAPSDDSSEYAKKYHYQGQKGDYDNYYLIRNCFFEPSLNPDFDWIQDCINRIRIIFMWKKPVIIGTHRINFIGSLQEKNREKNLILFDSLIKEILRIWPDVEFTTTDRLGEVYKKL